MSALVTPLWPSGLITLAEWDALPADEELRLECSEGVLVLNPSPRLGHQVATVRLAQLLQAQLPEWLVAPDVDVLLREVPLTIRTPDLVVVRPELLADDPPRLQPRDVLLAVEIISPGSRRTDRITKRSEYAEAGIPIYWVVDLEHREITCHRQPEGEEYGSSDIFGGRAAIPAPGSEVQIDVNSLKSRKEIA